MRLKKKQVAKLVKQHDQNFVKYININAEK